MRGAKFCNPGYAGAMITVLFFGRMADVAGTRRLEIAWPEEGLWLHALRERLLPGEMAARMSVNRQIMRADRPLADGDEVAFFSVFSGG